MGSQDETLMVKKRQKDKKDQTTNIKLKVPYFVFNNMYYQHTWESRWNIDGDALGGHCWEPLQQYYHYHLFFCILYFCILYFVFCILYFVFCILYCVFLYFAEIQIFNQHLSTLGGHWGAESLCSNVIIPTLFIQMLIEDLYFCKMQNTKYKIQYTLGGHCWEPLQQYYYSHFIHTWDGSHAIMCYWQWEEQNMFFKNWNQRTLKVKGILISNCKISISQGHDWVVSSQMLGRMVF